MDLDLRTFRRRREIGFRVEVHDWDHRRRNCTFRDGLGNMTARNPQRQADTQALHDHLEYNQVAGPFISFYTDWNAALRRRTRLIEKERATDVVIVAVWLKGLPGVYDAYSIASALHLGDTEVYLHEVLVHGGISFDSYRIMAMLRGIYDPQDVILRIDGLTMTVRLPGGFVPGGQHDATDALRTELLSCTGSMDDAKFLPLALHIGNIAYTSRLLNGGTEITWPFGGIGWHVAPVAAM